MLKSLPQLVCTNTEWNAKYMPMICSGFVIQYLAEESELPVREEPDERQAGELCALFLPNIYCVLILITAQSFTDSHLFSHSFLNAHTQTHAHTVLVQLAVRSSSSPRGP